MFVYTLEGLCLLTVCMIVKASSSFGNLQYLSPLWAYKLIEEAAQSQGDQTASCESPLLYVSMMSQYAQRQSLKNALFNEMSLAMICGTRGGCDLSENGVCISYHLQSAEVYSLSHFYFAVLKTRP